MDPLADEMLQAILVKGAAALGALAAALGREPGALDRALSSLLAAGLVEDAPPRGTRLTGEGLERARALFAADRERLGGETACAALEQFAGLDASLKQILTDWQLRADLGPATLNDHSDPRYDERVLRRLASQHARTCRWLDGFSDQLARAARYRARLERAHASIESGDLRFLASPLVDSYHSIWFELHEDWIRLAGRTRAEIEAGSDRTP